MNSDTVIKNFKEMSAVLEKFSTMENADRIADAASVMTESLRSGGQIISCGNGGSLCDAMHFSEELTARFRTNRAALSAVAVSDPAYLTCVSNDFGYDQTVSRYVEACGRKGDVLLAISTSGSSKNIVIGARAAKAKGMKVVALTGNDGGDLAEISDVEIRAPHHGYSDRIQEIHIKVIHTLVQLIECNIFGKS